MAGRILQFLQPAISQTRGSIWICARLAVDAMVCLWPTRKRRNAALVVRIDRLGDFILWIDAARALAHSSRRNGMHTTLIANDQWADWARELRIFDEVMALDVPRFSSSLSYRMHMEFLVRRRGFSVAIQPTYTRHWVSGDAIIRTCGAPVRIGSAGEPQHKGPFHRPLGDQWYTRLIPARAGCLMEIQRNAEFMSGQLGEELRPRVADLREAALRAPSAEIRAIIEDQVPYFVLVPGASVPGKRWPAQSFVEVANRLHETTGWKAIACGGTEDSEVAVALSRHSNGAIANLAGKTTIAELATVLLHARLVVGNDTAAIHLAAAVHTPSVCVLGGGQFGRFVPYSHDHTGKLAGPIPVFHWTECFHCNWDCKHAAAGGAYPCIEEIAVDDVWNAIAPLLFQTATFSIPFRQHGRRRIVAAD
jgi:ADP-heptose:LPS heptosyltransferase